MYTIIRSFQIPPELAQSHMTLLPTIPTMNQAFSRFSFIRRELTRPTREMLDIFLMSLAASTVNSCPAILLTIPVIACLENAYPNRITRAAGSICRSVVSGVEWLRGQNLSVLFKPDAPLSASLQRLIQNKEVSVEDIENDVCPIIHEPLRKLAKSGELTETHCGHKFSRSNIVKWLEQKPECPTCRAPNTKDTLTDITLKTKKVVKKSSVLTKKKEPKKILKKKTRKSRLPL